MLFELLLKWLFMHSQTRLVEPGLTSWKCKRACRQSRTSTRAHTHSGLLSRPIALLSQTRASVVWGQGTTKPPRSLHANVSMEILKRLAHYVVVCTSNCVSVCVCVCVFISLIMRMVATLQVSSILSAPKENSPHLNLHLHLRRSAVKC